MGGQVFLAVYAADKNLRGQKAVVKGSGDFRRAKLCGVNFFDCRLIYYAVNRVCVLVNCFAPYAGRQNEKADNRNIN